METFREGQRVKVKQIHLEKTKSIVNVDAPGVVFRVRSDGGAWVSLDTRHANEDIHSFPKGDTREKHVLVYPEECEEV